MHNYLAKLNTFRVTSRSGPPPPVPIHSTTPSISFLPNYCRLASSKASLSNSPSRLPTRLALVVENGDGVVVGGDGGGGGGVWVLAGRGGDGGRGGARGAAGARAAAGAAAGGDRGFPARRGQREVRSRAGGGLHGAVRGRPEVQRHRGRGHQLRPDHLALRGLRARPLPLVPRPRNQRRRPLLRCHLLRRRRRIQALPPRRLRGPAALHSRPRPRPHVPTGARGRIDGRRRCVAMNGRIGLWYR